MANKKRSIKISGHDTSISLEEEFWEELKQIAAREKLSLNALISKIDQEHVPELKPAPLNLSSILRVYILTDLQRRLISARTHPAHL